jgi:hypothetical protein
MSQFARQKGLVIGISGSKEQAFFETFTSEALASKTLTSYSNGLPSGENYLFTADSSKIFNSNPPTRSAPFVEFEIISDITIEPLVTQLSSVLKNFDRTDYVYITYAEDFINGSPSGKTYQIKLTGPRLQDAGQNMSLTSETNMLKISGITLTVIS